MATIGTKYYVVSTDETIELINIVKKEGTKILSKPVYRFKYIGKDKPNFTTYLEHINEAVYRERWVEV
jgi:hypothetical protein